jgi:hypothetical protein
MSHKPRPCDTHQSFAIEAVTVHIEGSNLYYTELTMACSACGTPMMFRGALGLSPDHPTVSLDGLKATLPAVPSGEDLRSESPLHRLTVQTRGGAGFND